MDRDSQIRLALYEHFAETGRAPRAEDVALRIDGAAEEVEAAYRRLAERRVLVLGADGRSIRMAPPFSGIPTGHRVQVGGLEYFANCCWDAFGIPAALHRPGEVTSSCAQSLEPLRLSVSAAGPSPAGSWVAHFAVPAARWWQDIVYT